MVNSQRVQALEEKCTHMQYVHENEVKELKRMNVKVKRSIQLFDNWTTKLRLAIQTQMKELLETNAKLLLEN